MNKPGKGMALTDVDIEVLTALFLSTSTSEAANSINMSESAARYHIAKIERVTGLNPYRGIDMLLLYERYICSDDIKRKIQRLRSLSDYAICHNRHRNNRPEQIP